MNLGDLVQGGAVAFLGAAHLFLLRELRGLRECVGKVGRSLAVLVEQHRKDGE